MKRIALSLVGLVLLGASTQAQTIIGESTYEDNYLHTPPPAPVEPPAGPAADRAKAAVPPARNRPASPDRPR